jgi:tetratricopeptide (TPR) repeat protein
LAPSDEAARETTAYIMESIQHYTLAIATPPDVFMDNWNRGYAYELIGESEQALKDYTEVIKLEPTFVKGYLYRARVLEQRGERALALTDLKEAVRLEPENPEIAAAIARLSK